MQRAHQSRNPVNAKRGPAPQSQGGGGRFSAGPADLRTVASALKVRNFRTLVTALGEEHLAVLLEGTIARIREMADGLNVTDEMAYHIESTLGLPSGFMDQVNPTLSTEDIERLKSLKPESRVDDTPFKPSAPAAAPAPAAPAVQSAPSVKKPSSKRAAPVINQEKPVNAKATANKSDEKPMTDEERLRQVRRDNLQVLTRLPGTKSQLGKLTNLSAANISHRLHGVKIFDRDTADFFCETLGMPLGWFDTPQEDSTIPDTALKMLLNKDSTPLPSSHSTKALASKKPKTGARLGRKPRSASVVPKNLAPTHPVVRGALSLGQSALGRTPEEPIAPTVAATPQPATAARKPASNVLATAESSRAPAVGTVVDALLRTLELKAESGRLTQEHALKLLVDVAAL